MLAKALEKGNTIGIVVPSNPYDSKKKEEFDKFVEYMQKEGLKVKLSKNFYAVDKYGSAAGAGKLRAGDINSMFADKSINAIWSLHGGDLANQTLEFIDYNLIKKNPKIFMGKSDIDVLLLAINKMTGLITIHCCDPKIGGKHEELDDVYTQKCFRQRLFKKSKSIEANTGRECIRKGVAKGKILGCNLSSVLKLSGTKYFPDFTGAILFIETYKSSPKILLSQLTQLEQQGVFDKIKGIVLGSNYGFEQGNADITQSKITDNKNKNRQFKVENIVKDFCKNYTFPILKTDEFGHYQPHAFLPIGAMIKLDATHKSIEILEDFLN